MNLNNLADSGAIALKMTGGNTQSDNVHLGYFDIGTSEAVTGLTIKGAGSNGAQTGVHLTLWGSTDNNVSNVISVGHGSTFTDTFKIGSEGTIQSIGLPNARNNLKYLNVHMPNTQNATDTVYGQYISMGTSQKTTGELLFGTGSLDSSGKNVHQVLWGNTTGNANKVLSIGNGTTFSERLYVLGDGTLQTLGKVRIGTSSVPGCMVMGDSDGSGVSYITVNDGVMSISTTAPSVCN